MLNKLFAKFRGQSKTEFMPPAEPAAEAKLNDPLDPRVRQRMRAAEEGKAWGIDQIQFRKASEFPTFDGLPGDRPNAAMDEALKKSTAVMDDSSMPSLALKAGGIGDTGVPESLVMWYASQGFFGYQMCAVIAQHWLVDKACSMPGEDAARNGWVISAQGGEEDLPKDAYDKLVAADKRFKLKENLVEFNRLKNVFGIRVAIFKVKSSDPLYYEKPFNIDGVGKDSYLGISQVDPYWMTPVLDSAGSGDPSTIGFYEPQYWVINGTKYHISHLAISRGPQPADILKPTYIFGGIPLTQRIYERVYAAERTANESPLLAMSKRTMAIHADIEKVLADQCAFEDRLRLWIAYRDNHGIKVLGTEEQMEQFDTSLTDFDSVIMNQYQIVAAIARVPATKLLGTSPKGFNATGEFESKSYHEELESIQEHVMMPMLERHYAILSRSLGMNLNLGVVFNPVDSVNTRERADLNKLKADTGIAFINAGVISPDEERERLMDDEHSGYDRLRDDITAEAEPGMSPENLANLQKAGAAETAAEQPPAGAAGIGQEAGQEHTSSVTPQVIQALLPLLLKAAPASANKSSEAALLALLTAVVSGRQGAAEVPDATMRSVSPSTSASVQRSVGVSDAEVVRQLPLHRMPKIRLNGLNLVIENPRGTVRLGTNVDGTEWACEMPDHYGFIKGYIGADGDDVDCFIGPNLRADTVYVIIQNCPETGEFDEYKCMLCYDSPEAAEEAYRASYGNWDGFGGMHVMHWGEFQDWLDSGQGAKSPEIAMDEFKESDHPRDKGGQFTSGSGGGGAAKAPKGAASAHLKEMPANRDEWPDAVKAMKLPPAWTNVRATTDPNSKLIAVGKDEKGRSQYVYSNAFRESQEAQKFARISELNKQMGGMLTKVSADQKSKDAATRSMADSMSLVMKMGIRPGSDRDTKAEKKAFGATNLEGRHIVEKDGKLYLDFTGKKGVDLSLPVTDPALSKMLRARKAQAGANGKVFPGVDDKKMLAYAHTLGSGDFKTKDFRTHVGTSRASAFVNSMPAPTNQKEYVKAVKEVGKRVSSILGNTPTVALQSYIDPSVFLKWKAGLK